MKKQKKRFSMRNKLMIVFGALIFAVGFTLSLFAIRTARKAVTEKVETHLIDKATDTAEIIDGRVNAMFQFLEGVARMPIFADPYISYGTKSQQLNKEVAFTNLLYAAAVTDTDGNMYTEENKAIKVNSYDWYKAGIDGKPFLTEPFVSVVDGKLIMTIS